jgi:hypothetical protein
MAPFPPNPTPNKLRYTEQDIINFVFDELKNRLRVDAIIDVEHIDIGNVGVLDENDVRINPATEETLDDILNALGGGTPLHEYGEASALPATETLIVSYTVPTGKKARIRQIHATGQSTAIFKLKINNTAIWTGRIAWTDRNIKAAFEGVELIAGDTIKITALHNQSTAQNYQADIDGFLI